MMPSASRCLTLAVCVLALAGCQHDAAQPATPTAAETLPPAYQQLEQQLSSGQLEQARVQLSTLKAQAPNDSRLDGYQRMLAEAYLQQSQAALQRGDMDAATQALIHARALLPQAPALGTQLPSPPGNVRETPASQ